MRGFAPISLLVVAGSTALAAPLVSFDNVGSALSAAQNVADNAFNLGSSLVQNPGTAAESTEGGELPTAESETAAAEEAIAPAQETLEGTVNQVESLEGEGSEGSLNLEKRQFDASSINNLVNEFAPSASSAVNDGLSRGQEQLTNAQSTINNLLGGTSATGEGEGSDEGGDEVTNAESELSTLEGSLGEGNAGSLSGEEDALKKRQFDVSSISDLISGLSNLSPGASATLSKGQAQLTNAQSSINNALGGFTSGGSGSAGEGEGEGGDEVANAESELSSLEGSLSEGSTGSLSGEEDALKKRQFGGFSLSGLINELGNSPGVNEGLSQGQEQLTNAQSAINNALGGSTSEGSGLTGEGESGSELTNAENELSALEEGASGLNERAAAACPAAPAADAKNIYRVDGLVVTETNGKATNIQFNVARSPAGEIAVKCRPDTGLFTRFKEDKKLECKGLGNGRYKFAWYGGKKDTLWLQYDGYLHSKVAGTSTVPLQCSSNRCEAPCPIYISMVKN